MAAMSVGPPVSSSEEVELLACRKTVEFATDATPLMLAFQSL